MPRPVAAPFDRVAHLYHQRVEPVYGAVAQGVVPLLRLEGGEHVLEVGAGSGCLTQRIAPLLPNGHVVATDISVEMLKLAAATLTQLGCSNVTLARDDVMAMDLIDGQFDLIVSQFTPLLSAAKPVADSLRVLRPGGRLVAVIWDEETKDEEDRILDEIHRELGLAIVHRSTGTNRSVRRRLERAGYASVTVEPWTLPVSHTDYVSYRQSFPPYASQSALVRRRYTRLLETAVRKRVPSGQPLVFDLTLLTVVAEKP